ncbi:hypothetical protein HanPI659440_Chr12g0473241 [Helianthus annuus]|nr:hypothetical protein HanPI659440_Chr12g0473241 [Helianthus annuus]
MVMVMVMVMVMIMIMVMVMVIISLANHAPNHSSQLLIWRSHSLRQPLTQVCTLFVFSPKRFSNPNLCHSLMQICFI